MSQLEKEIAAWKNDFRDWACCLDLRTDANGEFESLTTQAAWVGWHAAMLKNYENIARTLAWQDVDNN